MEAKRRFLIGLPVIVAIGFFAGTCLAQSHSVTTRSTPGDGELKSTGSIYGEYLQGDKGVTKGAVGGGTRGYQYVTNTSKSPGKRGARGAVDGVPDAGSGKGNTFTTTVLQPTMKVGQDLESGSYQLYKAFLSFNTSAIPRNALINSATLYFYGKDAYIDGNISFDIQVVKSVYTEPLWNPDWGAIGSGPLGSLSVSEFHFDPNSAENSIQVSGTKVDSLITVGGITKIALVSSRTTAQVKPTGNEYVEIFSADVDNVALRPRLVVDYDGNAPEITPLLTWVTSDAQFKDTGVDKEEVYAGTTTLTFRVRYFCDDTAGGDGIEPENPRVLIDYNGNGVQDVADNDFYVPMQATDTNDTVYSDGKDYQAEAEVFSDGITNISYWFLFSADGNEAVGDPARKNLIVSIQEPKSSSGDDKFCFISSLR